MQSKRSIAGKAALFLGAAMAAMAATGAAAQSSVQVSGLIDTYVGSLKRSGDSSSVAVVNSSGMSTSWWGFKGEEDLGGGLRAQFALTGFFRPDVGGAGRYDADTLFARDANVGLAGSFGRVSLGRDLAPNFVPSITLNPFGGSFAFAPLLLHTQTSTGAYRGQKWAATVAGDTGWSNEVMYVTPTVNGWTGSLFLQLGEQAGHGGKNNLGANVMYFGGPLTLGAYFQSVKVGNPVDVTPGDSRVFSFRPYNTTTGAVYALAPAVKQNTWFAGAAYDLGVVKLYATYNISTNRLAAGPDRDRGGLRADTLQLGASAPLGQGALLFSWARTKVKAEGDFDAYLGSTGWQGTVLRNTSTLGYDYFLSRRTDLYANVSLDKLTDAGRAVSVGAGIRHRF